MPAGNYSIPQLPVGVYTVTIEHQGFKKLEFVDVEQVIGRTRTLNASPAGGGGRGERQGFDCFGAHGP